MSGRLRVAVAGLLAGVVAAGLILVGASAATASPSSPGVLRIQVVPALRGVPVRVAGRVVTTDSRGRASLAVPRFTGLDGRITVPQTHLGKDRVVVLDRIRGSAERSWSGRPLEIGLRTQRLVSWSFLRPDGREFPLDRVQSMRLKSNTGERVSLSGRSLQSPLWVAEMRVIQTTRGLEVKENYWVVESVMIGGTSAVNASQQRFVPAEERHWRVRLLLYSLRLSGQDLLFSMDRGRAIAVRRPDGTSVRVPLRDGQATIADLPRGSYEVRVLGGGLSLTRPVSVSRNTTDSLPVISYLDIGLVVGLGLAIASALILAGRPHLLAAVLRGVRSATRRAEPASVDVENGPEADDGSAEVPDRVGA